MPNIGFKGMHGIMEDLSTNAPPSNSYSGEPLAIILRVTPGIFRGKMGPGGGGQGEGGGGGAYTHPHRWNSLPNLDVLLNNNI